MIDYIKQNHLGLIIIVWLVLSSLIGGFGVGAVARDTTTITNPFNFTQGLTSTTGTFSGAVTIGSSGTAMSRMNFGECNIHASANTIAATSTVQVDCQSGTGTQTAISDLPAWTAGDAMFLTMATSTNTTVEGLSILGVNASTTAGFITIDLFNGTGTTFTWTANASSSWQYMSIR